MRLAGQRVVLNTLRRGTFGDQCRLGVSFDIERITETAPDDAGAEDEMRGAPAVLEREHSLMRLASVLRFVALASFYRTVVLAKTTAPPSASSLMICAAFLLAVSSP